MIRFTRGPIFPLTPCVIRLRSSSAHSALPIRSTQRRRSGRCVPHSPRLASSGSRFSSSPSAAGSSPSRSLHRWPGSVGRREQHSTTSASGSGVDWRCSPSFRASATSRSSRWPRRCSRSGCPRRPPSSLVCGPPSMALSRCSGWGRVLRLGSAQRNGPFGARGPRAD